MKLPLVIRFSGLDPSPAVEAAVRDRVAHLEHFATDLMSCHVTVEQQGRHQHQGHSYSVRLDLTLHGKEIAVTRQHDEDVYVALRDAVDAATRQLEDAVRIRRGDVKHHDAPRGEGA